MSERQVLEREFSEPTNFGDQNIVTNSIFNQGVNLGEYTQLNNCSIHGTVELSDHCIVTGCMIHNNEGHGITMGGNRNQNGVRLTGDNWPNNAIVEINAGRATLQSRGYLRTEPMLVGPATIIGHLDYEIENTNTTWRQFLLNNNLISRIYEIDDEQSDVVLIVLGEDEELIPDQYTGRFGIAQTYEAKSKFSDEITKKAWELLEEYMSSTQYFAFMEGSKIELRNKTGEFRLLIDKKGDFNILEGKTGEGIVASSGRIRSYDYPLGDEIAAFLDWFKFKTKELISQWNCGTYGIVKEGERR